MSTERLGHRERKKQQTREAIAQAAMELFAGQGYEATTLAEIAEAAGVSTRTLFAYYPCKEDMLFCGLEEIRDALAQALAERPTGEDALGTLRDFILSAAHEKTKLDDELADLVAADETLRSHKRARISQLQELLAAAIADDLDARPGDLRPQVAAASLTAALEVLELHDDHTRPPRTPEEFAAAIDPIIDFVRAGLQALPVPAPATP